MVVEHIKYEYRLVKAGSSDELEQAVRALCDQGWFPHGSLQVVLMPPSRYQARPVWTFFQPMVRMLNDVVSDYAYANRVEEVLNG